MEVRLGLFAGVFGAALLAGSAANATVYNFDVDYLGGGAATLAGGSDNMLGISFVSGDTINYTITAAGVGHWTSLTAGAPFIFGAMGDLDGNFGDAAFTYSASFLDGATTVFSASGSGSQGTADLGPRSLAYPNGMNFDAFTETLDVSSISEPTGTFANILPAWPGFAPEDPQLNFHGGPFFSFTPVSTSNVPEPSSLPMLLAGLGMIGGAFYFGRKRAKSI